MTQDSVADAIHTSAVTPSHVPTVAWPPDVAAFLALVDDIRHVAEVPTLATHLDRGRLTLILGHLWDVATHDERAEMLRHEASHVAHGCWMRQGDRDKRLWNVACDAIIHALGEADWEMVDHAFRRAGLAGEDEGSVTLGRLSRQIKRPLSVMPSERLYDVLYEARDVQGGGCGAAEHSQCDNSIESRIKAQQVGSAVLGAPGAGKDAGFRGTPTLPPVPDWIAQVLDWLVTRVVSPEDRQRSWRRPSRIRPDELPGYARTDVRAARFMLDASGSIGDELLGQLLAAVCSTPELAGSDVVVFDHVTREPIPASDVAAVLDSVSRAGGGTLIRAAGDARDGDKQTVWLTDGGTGDGWPEDAVADLWVVGASEPHPPGAPVVRRA